MPVGEHALPVRSEDAAVTTMSTFLRSREISRTASAVDEVTRSVIMSTLSTSYHWRAIVEATSGLFWWSPDRISIGMPLTLPPKSATAMRTASTAPLPARSAYGPAKSVMTPILTTPSDICASAAAPPNVSAAAASAAVA